MLLTGFDPFDGSASNSAGDAVALVASRWSSPIRLVTAVLPVAFAAAPRQLDRLIADHRPELVIATGLANGRAAITPERLAINLADARIPDNAGAQPLDEPIDDGGPTAYFSGLPVKAIVARLSAEGIPAALSQTAGTFVCNAVMYSLMRTVAGTDIRAGFIHVPCSPELAVGTSQPSATIETIARALELAIEVCLQPESLERIRGGAES
ncbi:pyroglutamyl-peptidase I [Glaciihabitans sp. INWT7]|nr:pyroglutamyl-peptidase I [Glaciihabitans sp. INWT7]